MSTAHEFWSKAVLLGVLASVAVVAFNDAQAKKPFKVRHEFAGAPTDGGFPSTSLILDDKGNLYGTAAAGGTFNYGAIFKVAPDKTETGLYSFGGRRDGAGHRGRL